MYPQCPAEGAADTFSPSPRREHPYTAAGEKQRCGSPSIGQKECGKGTRHFVTRHRTKCSLRGSKVFLPTEQSVPPHGTKRSSARNKVFLRGNKLFSQGEHVAPRRKTISSRRRDQAQRQERGSVPTYPIREDTDPLSLPEAANAAGAIPGRGAGDYSMPNSNVVPNSLRMDIVTRFFVRL